MKGSLGTPTFYFINFFAMESTFGTFISKSKQCFIHFVSLINRKHNHHDVNTNTKKYANLRNALPKSLKKYNFYGKTVKSYI